MALCPWITNNIKCIELPHLERYVKSGGNAMQKYCLNCKIMKEKNK